MTGIQAASIFNQKEAAMKQRVVCFALALASILIGLGVARSDTRRPNPRAPRSVLGTAFTYQGQLK